MKKNYKYFCLVCVVALFFLQGTCSKSAKSFYEESFSAEQNEMNWFKDGYTVYDSDLPKEVLHKGYSHPYRWNDIEGEKVQFKEIWGYVMSNRVSDWDRSAPLTDIGLFAVDVSSYGHLESPPSRDLIKNFNGRVHLVAVCNGSSLAHFVIDPRYGLRDKLVKDLIFASRNFDGLQIDYENILKHDWEDFTEFLRLLKKGLGNKMLTVCVPARMRTLQNDIFDYKRLGGIVDKVMIMAYDEHWSTSKPGSIASMDWCRKVGDYALSVLPKDKYIMGIPFYGRSWKTSKEGIAQAWYFNGSNRIMHDNDILRIKRDNGVPYFKYETTVEITHWYEDATSLVQRCRMYIDQGFTNIAFWRMGQEDAAFWDWIEQK